MLLGNTCAMKALSVKSPVFKPEVKPASGIARFMCAPGWNRLTSSRPSSSDTAEAAMNQTMARKPMRPTALASLMLARPDTRVANTSGAMIILIMRRKISVTRLKYEAMCAASVASCAVLLQR
ncbi:hypothetical protein D3C71_1512610 [compost metagenome]